VFRRQKAKSTASTRIRKADRVDEAVQRDLDARPVIEIDVREFRGDRDLLAKLVQEKLKVETRTERKILRVGRSDRPGADPSLQEVKDSIKRALHHMRMNEYHVVSQGGLVSIRERKARERHAPRKGAVPSARQTVPYFFPG